jgi:hypothetical protein
MEGEGREGGKGRGGKGREGRRELKSERKLRVSWERPGQ